MKKPFISLLSDFVDTNGKKILDQPDRFKSLFLDFSQNEYRAEALIFNQFLASKQAQELKNSEGVDKDFLKGIAERFYQTYFFDRSKCEQVVMAYAFFLGLIDKKTFSTGIDGNYANIATKTEQTTTSKTGSENATQNLILEKKLKSIDFIISIGALFLLLLGFFSDSEAGVIGGAIIVFISMVFFLVRSLSIKPPARWNKKQKIFFATIILMDIIIIIIIVMLMMPGSIRLSPIVYK